MIDEGFLIKETKRVGLVSGSRNWQMCAIGRMNEIAPFLFKKLWFLITYVYIRIALTPLYCYFGFSF